MPCSLCEVNGRERGKGQKFQKVTFILFKRLLNNGVLVYQIYGKIK